MDLVIQLPPKQFNWDTVQYQDNGDVLLLWRHERIFHEFNGFSNNIVCDVGSWGHLPERFEQAGATCFILDKLTDEQAYPDRVKAWPHFIEADLCDHSSLIRYNNIFDFVTCFEVLEHVKDQSAAFAGLYKILKSGGWLVATFPIPGKTHQLGDPTVTGWLDANQIKILLLQNGFKNITVETTASINPDDDHVSIYFKAQK